MSSQCPHCGENLEGDGYTSVIVCPYNTNEDTLYMAPDEGPVYCDFDGTLLKTDTAGLDSDAISSDT